MGASQQEKLHKITRLVRLFRGEYSKQEVIVPDTADDEKDPPQVVPEGDPAKQPGEGQAGVPGGCQGLFLAVQQLRPGHPHADAMIPQKINQSGLSARIKKQIIKCRSACAARGPGSVCVSFLVEGQALARERFT